MKSIIMLFVTLIVAVPALAAPPKTGEAAPDFSLVGSDGKTYKLSEFKGKTVVLEWFNKDCPYVRKFYDSKTMQALQKENTAKGIVWFSIVSSAEGKEGALDVAAAKKVAAEWGLGNTAILLDTKGEAGRAYGAKTTPHMFVIDKVGKVAYQGAIDDRPSATKKSLEGAQNYVTSALQALEKGEAIKTASTTPYGCSVKY